MVFATVHSEKQFLIGPETNCLELYGCNGSIVWEPIQDGTSRIVAQRSVRAFSEAAAREYLQALEVQEQNIDGRMVLRALNPPRPFGVLMSRVRFTVFALGEQFRDFQAQTANGRIEIQTPFDGTLRLTTQNGRITILKAMGQVQCKTANGRIEFGKLVLRESSTLMTANGRIEGQLELPEEGHYRLSTRNGSINLRLPHDTRGSLRAATSNGRVEVHLGDYHSSDRKEVVLGSSAGPRLELTTSNGPISVVGY